jgi:glycopeptide antibiotics resistance protein
VKSFQRSFRLVKTHLTELFFLGYSASALIAIIFAIPFGQRLLAHEDTERWNHFSEAFYTAHLELFLGNACLGEKFELFFIKYLLNDRITLGVGVLMLLVLTVERYVSVCHPGHMRPALGRPGYYAFIYFHVMLTQ